MKSSRTVTVLASLSLAAAMNGAEVVGVHFNSSYRDGFDLVGAMAPGSVAHLGRVPCDSTSHRCPLVSPPDRRTLGFRLRHAVLFEQLTPDGSR